MFNPFLGGFGPKNQNGNPMELIAIVNGFMSTNDRMGYIQGLLNSGKISQENANVLIEAVNTGNPQQVAQSLMNNGQMTQGQFNQLAQIAQQFQPFLHR